MSNFNSVELLLVEDNPADVILTLKALEKNKIVNNFFVVNDGAEALDYIYHKGKYSETNKNRYNLKFILLDLKLPKVDGMTALERKNRRFPRIPFILVTGSMNDGTEVEVMMAGAKDVIMKEYLARIAPSINAAI